MDIYIYIYMYTIYGSLRSKMQMTAKENIYSVNLKSIRNKQFPHIQTNSHCLKTSFNISCTD